MKKDVNKAKSLYTISPQSTLYVPIIDIPQKLPSYVNVDRHSHWQRTALISSALETVTLPSRLRPYHHFEASLAGEDGRHTIFELQSTINPKNTKDKDSAEGELPKAETEFDIDFTYGDIDSQNAHIFNQVQVTRGDEPGKAEESSEDDLGRLRKLRLYNSEAMLQRYFGSSKSMSQLNILTATHIVIILHFDCLPLTVSRTAFTKCPRSARV